ncbi:nidogen [Planococcus citri]|uniref:nidogen n=1 Tax=Planococcus citri TaxID=170843 RepID=UPI0031F7A168
MIAFKAFRCLILAAFVVWNVGAIPIQRFYSYGEQYGDAQLSKVDHEAYTPEIQLRVPVKFYSEVYSSLFVNANGLISFITTMSQYVNMQFPLDYPVIAALYANTDIRVSGSVFYRETNDVSLLSRASQEIRQFFPNSGARFQATSLFIATWYRVGYYNQKYDKVNTYQIVIASNNEESYVEFLYADDGIQWIQGDGQLGTGLPDAKAQAGLVAANGRVHTLQGSGTDQIRNLIRLSNTNEAGLFVFRTGPYDNVSNIEVPVTSQIVSDYVSYGDQITSCAVGFSRCHSQATCVDTARGFCCTCRPAFYGNGFNCLKDGVPLRASGKITIDVNGIKLNQIEIQAYINIQEGRAYVAISKVPSTVGIQLQFLYPITTMLNWLFAKPIGNGLNGFQITGGVLNHSAEIFYKETGDRISITQKYLGLDVTDQLKIEASIRGTVPQDKRDSRLTINDYQQQFNFLSKGLFRSSSTLQYVKNIISTGQEEQYEVSLDQTVHFNESCLLNSNNISANDQGQRSQYTYYRVKTARNFINYESRENILRFAATNKVSLLTENEDPCIEGRVKCVANSSCVVEGDSFKCVCNSGFHTTYSSSKTNEFGCLDVNECAEGKANCDSNAICINEVGSYQCACKAGYSGNGFYCTALETESPCVKNPALCNAPNSRCSDRNDPRTCDCLPGFHKQYSTDQPTGIICTDINECEYDSGSICGPNSACLNYAGGYSCVCQEGYSLDRDGNCQRKDASCNVLRNCSPNGECIYNETAGKYSCHCIRGYYGDGYVCQQTGGRHVVAKICTSGVCVCPPRFIAYENYCIENEFIPTESTSISCNTINSMCHPQAQCVYNSTAQAYKCICNAGFEGNGLECEASCFQNNFCDEHATCLEINGKAQCVCQSHYSGDGIHCIHSGMCNSDGDCEDNEECAYNEVSVTYECKCKAGYSKSPNSTCRPIARCPQCHPRARCTIDEYTRESRCECAPGYRGDGVYTCELAPVSCNTTNYCSPHASCLYNVTYDVFQCQCRQGFIGNGTNCQRVINCAVQPKMCDINARCTTRQYGVYNCECNPGFIGNGSYCTEPEKIEGGFLLINYGLGTVRLPLQGESSRQGYSIQLQADQIAIGLAIDCQEGKVYWSDYNGRKIKYSNYKGKNIGLLLDKDIENPEGLAIDWVGRTLYWTDAKKKSIQSINLDGTQRKTIISANLTNPRGIAVHPYKRKLFWTDWNRAHPKIEWSNLDGSVRSVFLSGADVQVPNSIAIDWSTEEVCWADAGTKRISCYGIDTRIQRLITANVSSPFGLTVSNDKYFWTDWATGKVGYYDRYTSRTDSITLQVGNSKLYGIVAVPNNCP